MLQVYLMRHGQTEGNLRGFHQGWGDVKLTDTGIAQAEALAALIEGTKFDRIISSDIYRTRQTAEILFGSGASIEYDERIREINNSVLAGLSVDEAYKIHGEKYLKNKKMLDYSAVGGESVASMLTRTASFLRELEEDKVSKKIAVVTHGGVIHAILSHVLGTSLYLSKFKIDNCSVTKLRYKGREWSVAYINRSAERTI